MKRTTKKRKPAKRAARRSSLAPRVISFRLDEKESEQLDAKAKDQGLSSHQLAHDLVLTTMQQEADLSHLLELTKKPFFVSHPWSFAPNRWPMFSIKDVGGCCPFVENTNKSSSLGLRHSSRSSSNLSKISNKTRNNSGDRFSLTSRGKSLTFCLSFCMMDKISFSSSTLQE